MKSTPQILENLPDEEKKKKFLKAENKLLRENLKRMSDNVNVLIEKMNQESMKKKTVTGGSNSIVNGGRNNTLNTSNQGPLQSQDGHGGGGAVTVAGGSSVGGGGAGGAAGLVDRSVKNASPHGGRSYAAAYNKGQLGERELANTDKAIVNLMKEHNKLKKRLELI